MNRISVAALSAFSLTATAHADPLNVFGTFLTEAGSSHVEITDCGDGTPCGAVSWIDPASVPDGQPTEIARSAKGEKILGLIMLQDFTRKKKDWRGGTIYDPENDKTYSSRLKRLDGGNLQVKGCIGPICQTQIWTPISAVAN